MKISWLKQMPIKLGEDSNLKARLFKAGGWVLGGFVVGQIIRLAGNLILTRLLFPEAFGLMAVVYVLMIGLALFSDLGLNQGVIRNPRGEEAVYLNTAWTIQILRGVLICILTVLLALMLPIVSSKGWLSQDSVYADPLLPWLIVAFSLTALIQGFESMNNAIAYRRLQFSKLTQIELVSQGIALAAMIGIAWAYHSIWALVAGGLISAAVKCVAGHIVLPGDASRFCWNHASVREIFHFGKWIFFLSILGFVSINGDRLILANLVNASTLGIYSIAFLLANMVNVAFSTILTKLVFPAISEVVQLRPHDVCKVYLKLQMTADIFLFGATGFLFVAGSDVVALLYDSRYHDAGRMLEILSLGLIALRYAIVEQYCLAIGAMRYLTISTLCRLLALFISLPLGYHFAGMNGALIAIVSSQFASWPVALHFKVKHGLLNLGRELTGLPVMVLMAGVGWGLIQLIAWAKGSL